VVRVGHGLLVWSLSHSESRHRVELGNETVAEELTQSKVRSQFHPRCAGFAIRSGPDCFLICFLFLAQSFRQKPSIKVDTLILYHSKTLAMSSSPPASPPFGLFSSCVLLNPILTVTHMSCKVILTISHYLILAIHCIFLRCRWSSGRSSSLSQAEECSRSSR
jgi:hypothetical protein